MKNFIMVFMLFTSLAFAKQLGGEIAGTLTAKDSPYYIVEDIVVPPGERLTIEPGVLLKFDSTVVFRVDGTLLAKGSESQKILFTSSNNTPQGAAWEGIQLSNRSSDETILENCRIEFARRGLSFFAVSPVIRNCEIVDSESDGIVCQVSRAIIAGNLIQGNGGDGISAKAMKGQIVNNIIIENGGDGLHLSKSECLVAQNEVRLNGDDGLFFSNSSGMVRENIILQNKDDGILVDGDSPKIFNNIIARHRFGVFAYNAATPLIVNCTIADNIYGLYGRARATLRVENSIVWNNETAVFTDSLSTASIAFSDIEGGFSGIGNFSGDPGFIEMERYSLSPDSPCIGSGAANAAIKDEKLTGNNVGAWLK